MIVPDRNTFESAYAGKAPWDIGRPQKAFLDVAAQITGNVLDAGCGTGDNALFFAGRGCTVTGIDFLEEPIRRAKRKAAEHGLSVTFLVKDATTLMGWSERFDRAIDCGLFHVFSDDDRKKYVDGLASILKPGGKLFLLCFSDAEPGTQGPRRLSRKEINAGFADGWVVEIIAPSRFEVRPDMKDLTFSEGGPKAWFLVAKRVGSPKDN
jgi:ubiquinone/menaquinone biosynthesis C-methylase UbiE